LNEEEVIKLTKERLEAGKDAVAAVFLAKK
jgi:hypothetical protein